ncbi:MAG: MFS transporter [Myxococcota bacterium]
MSQPGPTPDEQEVPIAAFATLWLTLFIDLVGFGIIIPVLPFYASSFGASPQVVALLSTAFSAAHFLASPLLGRLSDRVGRRPVMLVSIGGTCLSMLVLGFATTLWMVFAARVLSGISGANISTAHAYVADRVAPAKRAKYMGLMGSAIGLGFVFGPAIGGLLATPESPELPFFVAAGLSVANWIMALIWLPESHRTRGPAAAGARIRLTFASVRKVLLGTQLGYMVLLNFTFFMAFSAMESTYALLLEARLSWGAQQTGGIFAFVGVVIVLTQGVLVGRMVAGLGERRTLMVGVVVLALGLAAVGLAPSVWLIFVGSAGIAAGNGLMAPSINALVSRQSDEKNQGFTLGLSTSAASLGRIVGPIWGGITFELVSPGTPLVTAALIVGATLWVVVMRVRESPTDEQPAAD